MLQPYQTLISLHQFVKEVEVSKERTLSPSWIVTKLDVEDKDINSTYCS
jgi:hypothetical protein